MDHRAPLVEKLSDFLARATNASDKAAPGGLLPKIADALLGSGNAGAKTEIVGILRDLFSLNQLDLPLDAIKESDFKQEFATKAGDVLSLILAGAGSPGLALASKVAIKILKSRIEACGADKNSSVVRGLPVKPDDHGQDVILYYVEDKNGIPVLPKVDGSEMLALGILQAGFQNWASRLNLVANMVTKQEEANLIVSGADLGANTTILARTEIGPPKGRQLRMVFNLSKPFTSDEFESNVAHEFGHALGIMHEDVVQDGTQVMNSQLVGVKEPQGPGKDTDLGAAIFKGWRPA